MKLKPWPFATAVVIASIIVLSVLFHIARAHGAVGRNPDLLIETRADGVLVRRELRIRYGVYTQTNHFDAVGPRWNWFEPNTNTMPKDPPDKPPTPPAPPLPGYMIPVMPLPAFPGNMWVPTNTPAYQAWLHRWDGTNNPGLTVEDCDRIIQQLGNMQAREAGIMPPNSPPLPRPDTLTFTNPTPEISYGVRTNGVTWIRVPWQTNGYLEFYHVPAKEPPKPKMAPPDAVVAFEHIPFDTNPLPRAITANSNDWPIVNGPGHPDPIPLPDLVEVREPYITNKFGQIIGTVYVPHADRNQADYVPPNVPTLRALRDYTFQELFKLVDSDDATNYAVMQWKFQQPKP